MGSLRFSLFRHRIRPQAKSLQPLTIRTTAVMGEKGWQGKTEIN